MEKEIDLKNIAQLLLSKMILILVVSLIGTALSFGITKFMISPKYESRSSMYIKSASSSSINGVSYQEILSAQELVKTYLVIIKSENVCQAVANAVNLGYTGKEITSMVTVNAIDNTEVFEIVVTGNDPKEAYTIMHAFEELGPLEIERVVGVENIKIIDSAKIPTTKSSPSTTKNTLLGFLISLVAISFVIIVIDMFDNKVKNAEDLKNKYDIPVLALIPSDESEL